MVCPVLKSCTSTSIFTPLFHCSTQPCYTVYFFPSTFFYSLPLLSFSLSISTFTSLFHCSTLTCSTVLSSSLPHFYIVPLLSHFLSPESSTSTSLFHCSTLPCFTVQSSSPPHFISFHFCPIYSPLSPHPHLCSTVPPCLVPLSRVLHLHIIFRPFHSCPFHCPLRPLFPPPYPYSTVPRLCSTSASFHCCPIALCPLMNDLHIWLGPLFHS